MVPCDLFLSQKLEVLLKGDAFEDTEEIKQNAMTQLFAVPKSQFQKCFGQWRDSWNKCVVSEGDCLEGD
jgi:hypothetical protein